MLSFLPLNSAAAAALGHDEKECSRKWMDAGDGMDTLLVFFCSRK